MVIEVHAHAAKSAESYQRITDPISACCLDEIEDDGYPIYQKLGLIHEQSVYGNPITRQSILTVIKDLKTRYPIEVRVLASRRENELIEWNSIAEMVCFLEECLEWAKINNENVRLSIG